MPEITHCYLDGHPAQIHNGSSMEDTDRGGEKEHMKGKAALLLLILGLALLLVAAGCQGVEEAVQRLKPEIRGTTVEWGEVTAEATEVTATLLVYNPSHITLPVKKVTSDIYMNDIPMGSAETVGLSIEKNTEFPVTVSARIDNTRIPAFWAEHLRRHEQSEALIQIGATFDLGIAEFTSPFSLRRPITTDLLAPLGKLGSTVLEKAVKLPGTDREVTAFKVVLKPVSAEWGIITEQSTEIELTAVVRNDNPYPLPVPDIAYRVNINGLALASGQSALGLVIAPYSEKEVITTVTLNTGRMGQWFASHIRNGERSTFNIKVSLVFELPAEVAEQLGQDKKVALVFGLTPEAVKQLDQGKLVVPVWEGTHTFSTSILGGR